MRLARFLFAAVLIICSAPAFARPACYAPKQVQAEQLLRLHSELMVITATCREGSDGRALSPAYASFTQKNIRVLHDAEQTMIAYYRATEKGDPVEKLDHLRTKLGNEIGQKVAVVSAPSFCEMYRDRVEQFAAATSKDIDDHVRRMEISERPYAKTCGNPR